MSETILPSVRQVRRRLNGIRFLQSAVWSLTAWLSAGCLLTLADKAFSIGLPTGWLLAVCLLAGLLTAAIWTFLRRQALLDAAIALDARCGLAERVSTLLTLGAAELEQPAGIALANDVERSVAKLRASDHFPVRLPRFSWAPVLPAAMLLAIAYFVAPFDLFGKQAAQAVTVEERKLVDEEAKLLEKKLDERRKQASETELPENLKELTEDVSKATREISQDKKLSAKEAVIKLNDLARSLEDRRKDLDSLDAAKRSLARMPTMFDGPAKQLSQALKNGDFKEAAKQMEQIKKQLESGKLSAKEKEKLAEQLQQLQNQLKQISDMKKREEQLAKSLPPDQLKKELEKLQKDREKLEKLSKLAEQMAKCANCMSGDKDGQSNGGNSEGNAQKPSPEMAKALENAQDLLEQLSKDDAACQMLDEMLADISQCKGGMCRGLGDDPDRNRVVDRDFSRGGGRGQGKRAEAKDDTRSRETRAESKIQKGPAFIAGQVNGNNFRGESRTEIREAASAAARAADEAVTRQKVPTEYKDHAREYFNRLNGELK